MVSPRVTIHHSRGAGGGGRYNIHSLTIPKPTVRLEKLHGTFTFLSMYIMYSFIYRYTYLTSYTYIVLHARLNKQPWQARARLPFTRRSAGLDSDSRGRQRHPLGKDRASVQKMKLCFQKNRRRAPSPPTHEIHPLAGCSPPCRRPLY